MVEQWVEQTAALLVCYWVVVSADPTVVMMVASRAFQLVVTMVDNWGNLMVGPMVESTVDLSVD